MQNMNTVLNIFRRETGNGFSRCYDAPLLRLAVHERDSWNGIVPSQFTTDFHPSPPILAAKFAKTAGLENMLAIANEDGKIAIQDTNVSSENARDGQALDGKQCHFNAVFDIEWMPGEMKLVSASGDHTARLWAVTETGMQDVQIFSGHTRSVKTAAFRREDPAVFATGGRDGAIIIWDIRAQLGSNMAPRADNCIMSGHAGGPGTPASLRRRVRGTPKIPSQGCSSSITGLAFQNDNTLISCGAGDGIVKVWDIRRHYSSHQRDPLPKYSFPYAGTTTLKGFTNLLIDEVRQKLFVNCMNNTIYCYDISTYNPVPVQRYGGFKNGSFYVKSCLSPDGQYLVSGSSDEKCYIWNVDDPNPLAKLSGHTVEVTCVSWMQNTRDIRIVTCSDDAHHKIWRLAPEEIDSEERNRYRGFTEYCSSYRSSCPRPCLKLLEFTPRSSRRIVERNEKTPNTLENTTPTTAGTLKRTYTEMTVEDVLPSDQCPQTKRPHLESRGRRLFSPSNPNCKSIGVAALEMASSSSSSRCLHVILEESDERSTPCKSPLSISDLNLKSPESSGSAGAGASTGPYKSLLRGSPTVNLPNYVIDGEAPHLVNVSSYSASTGGPGSATGLVVGSKRKLKENYDWLTKIRKQKLLQAAKSIETNGSIGSDDELAQLMSPRLQQLKSSSESTSIVSGGPMTPHRRHSRSGAESACSPHGSGSRTPTSRSRPTTPEASIRRFFTITTPSSAGRPNIS